MSEKKIGRWLCRVFAAGIFAAAGALTAFAAGGVGSLRIDLNDVYETGEIMEPEVVVMTSGVELESLTWNKAVDEWKPGSRVTATIYLVTTDGRDFADSYGSKTIKINGGTVVGAQRAEEGRLKVTARYYPVVQLDSPDEAGWTSAAKTTAVWKKSKYATGYQIRLYRDGNLVHIIDATGTSKDLSSYMTKEGDYNYEIRAIGKDRDDQKYMRSSEYISSSERAVADLGDTSGKFRTYAEGNKYQREDGSYVAGQWYKIRGEWYYFDASGYAVSGWQAHDGKWYYFDPDCTMETGWKQVNGVWYYLNPDGSMATGWAQTAPNQWYYMNADGSMAADTIVDGYQLDSSGMRTD